MIAPHLLDKLTQVHNLGGTHPLVTLKLLRPELLAITGEKLAVVETTTKGFVLRLTLGGQQLLQHLGKIQTITEVASRGPEARMVAPIANARIPAPTPLQVETSGQLQVKAAPRTGFTIPANHPRNVAKTAAPPTAQQTRFEHARGIKRRAEAGMEELQAEAQTQVELTAKQHAANNRAAMFAKRGLAMPGKGQRTEGNRFYEGDQGQAMQAREVKSGKMPNSFYKSADDGEVVRDFNGVAVNTQRSDAGTRVAAKNPDLARRAATGREGLVKRMTNADHANAVYQASR